MPPVKLSVIGGMNHYVIMIKTIEVRDRHDGAFNANTYIEFHSQMSKISSPRETVRLFHRCNSCDCLKELYYKLKETTKRTTPCWNCEKQVDIQEISECQCKLAKYCSYDCAVAQWPEHKTIVNNGESSVGVRMVSRWSIELHCQLVVHFLSSHDILLHSAAVQHICHCHSLL